MFGVVLISDFYMEGSAWKQKPQSKAVEYQQITLNLFQGRVFPFETRS